VELYLFDRLHNKPKYGSRAKLITDLLEKWVEEQRTLANQENPSA
jgi:metal-responsive CopG/Arc/MetJ family transcriptional regulator